jgi:hypothetical protein
MKKQLLNIVCTLLSIAANAEEPKYCELSVYQPNFKRFVAEVNYVGSHKRKFNKIKGADGKQIRFEAKLDALNYMLSDGWEVVSESVTRNDTRFFLKKA